MKALATFRSRGFVVYSAVNSLAFAAAWMQRLAIGWFLWTKTGSGLILGLLAACDLGPALLLGPLGGVLGDRVGPRRVLVWSQGATILLTGLGAFLLWFSVPGWSLLILATAIGCSVALADAPRAAIVTSLVPADQAGAAIALTSILINAARFVGPIGAGSIGVAIGLPAVLAAAAVAIVPMFLFVVLHKADPTSVDIAAEHRHWLREIISGLAYARAHPLIGPILLNFLLSAMLTRAVYELLPGLGQREFGLGFDGVSTLTAAIGIGAIASGVMMLREYDADRAARLSFVAAGMGGLCVLLLSATRSVVLALPIFAAIGFAISMTATAAQIAVQLSATLSMRSRVLSLWSLAIRAGPAMGALLIGTMADQLGFRMPLSFAAAATALFASVGWIRLKRRFIRK